MVGWHHQLNGHESEQTPGESEGQGSLGCCSSWDCRVGHNLATEQQQNRWYNGVVVQPWLPTWGNWASGGGSTLPKATQPLIWMPGLELSAPPAQSLGLCPIQLFWEKTQSSQDPLSGTASTVFSEGAGLELAGRHQEPDPGVSSATSSCVTLGWWLHFLSLRFPFWAVWVIIPALHSV